MSATSFDLYRRLSGETNNVSHGSANLPGSDSKRIAFVIPRGEAVRNFVHTGALAKLAEKADVDLISVPLADEISRPLVEEYGPIHLLTEHPERWLVRFEREILEIAHNRWLWSQASRSRARLHDAAAVTIRQKLIRTTKKFIGRTLAHRAGVKALSRVERISSRFLKTTHAYLNLMKDLQPSLVFNGSHVHSSVATQAVQAAQWLGIPTATFIFSWDNLTSQGRILLPYDHFLVWNDQLKRQLVSMYDDIRPEQVLVTGTPQFDFHFRPEFYQPRMEFCSQIGADPGRPIVLYTTGMANHMPGEPQLVEEIADILNKTSVIGKPQLLVRVYPKDLTGRFETLKRTRRDILFQKTDWERSWLTPRFEDTYGLINALRHCSLGINIASTVSLELCMFDKPVINVGYNPAALSHTEHRFAEFYEFDHYRPVVTSGAVEVAWSPRDMRELIELYLHEPARRRSERKRLIDAMFGDTLDGRSAQRVAETLLDLADAKLSQ